MAVNAGIVLCHFQMIIAVPLMLAALFILLLEGCLAFRQCNCGGSQISRLEVLKMFRLPALLMTLSFVGAAFDIGIPKFIYCGITQVLAGLALAVGSTRLKPQTDSGQESA